MRLDYCLVSWDSTVSLYSQTVYRYNVYDLSTLLIDKELDLVQVDLGVNLSLRPTAVQLWA